LRLQAVSEVKMQAFESVLDAGTFPC